jgi:phosphoglucomutase/phosphomannomutase
MMITASHNPPSDNAVKVYGPSGGQFVPPHDENAIRRMRQVRFIRRAPFRKALDEGRIVCCQQELDAAFVAAVASQSLPGPRTLKILYSPLHGVGGSAVLPVLRAVGFDDVEVFGPHAAPDPDFSNVPGHVSNPENPAVFDAMIERARQTGAELILATDPDCDRLGCATPSVGSPGSRWITLTGNQIGALLADFLLGARRSQGTLTADHYVVKTLVTTDMIRRIADGYGAATFGNLLVGFKWIGDEIDRRGPEKFVLGVEESYGFLAGDHVRDKDGAVAAMLLAECAARLKTEGLTLYEKLDLLYREHGYFAEGQFSVFMPGEKGMDEMNALMAGFRGKPPESLAGMQVVRVRDYLSGAVTERGGRRRPLDAPTGDMLIFDLDPEGNYFAVRPSGTEPKVKYYTFAYEPAARIADLAFTKRAVADRLAAMRADLEARK